jgi:mono/diheme cytochrome c family protein
MRKFLLATFLGTLALSRALAITPEETEFFEKHVRPVLAEQCYKCHGPEKQKAELRLDSREAVLKGSDIGPVVVPGKPEESSLIKSIKHEGDSKMPEKADKMPEQEIAALAEWVRMGVPWPEEAAQVSSQEQAAKSHWAFQPVRKQEVPQVADATGWAQSPIDRFILARLEQEGITPSPVASRAALLRRATFGLTGLPPTLEEVQAFENDSAPGAFVRVVDRLLASPRYGERWGRFWLDVARYADTKGYVFQEERRYPFAYTYRDWVIRALNEDLPYDQFLIQQIAADHLVTGEDKRSLAAMGFLTLGRRFLNNQPDIIDDRIDVLTRGTMGLTVSCARCHDHKFDPISQKDYYALYGVFASSMEPGELPLLGADHDPTAAAEYRKEFAAREQKLEAFLAEKAVHVSTGLSQVALLPVIVPPVSRDVLKGLISRLDRDKARELQNKIDEVNASPNAPPRAMVLQDAKELVQPHVFKRGNPNSPGEAVPRRFISVLAGGEPQPFQKGSGRLELAQAIANPANPLTARVMVNRVWMHHIGNALVRTPGDFGVKGEAPTHPELLDYLAQQFVEEGWSLKKLHRMILLSSAYQQSSEVREEVVQRDPENRLLWRANRRRLDFEATRDSLLQAAGHLDLTVGGRAVELTKEPFPTRRTIYGFIDRQNLPGVFRTFDFASPDTTSPQRHSTTVPQQALFMLNSPFVIEQARSLVKGADFPAAEPDEAALQKLYARVFARPAEPHEVRAGLEFIKAQLTPVEAEAEEAPLWQYGYGAPDESGKLSFTVLPVFRDQTWKGGKELPDKELGWVSLTANGGHPGGKFAAIRRWTAPRDAKVTIGGAIERPSSSGDGIRVRILLNPERELLSLSVPAGGKQDATLESVELKRGDTVDFVVECGGDENSDGFTWAPTIRTEGDTWSAEAQFAGPPAKRGAPLTAWEKYAQVLLAANEFVFVD